MPAMLRRSSIEIADVRQDQIDAGQVLLLRERHADIDRRARCGGARRRARRSTGSCRSRRRRRAARTRARRCGPAITCYLRGTIEARRLPRSSALSHRRRRRTKRPRVVERLEGARALAFGGRHADRLAEARGAREPVGADRGKARAAVPLRQPRHHRGRQRREQAFGRGADAGRGEIGRGKFGAGRMMRAVDADADARPPRPRLRSGCRRTCCGRSGGHSAISAPAAPASPGMRAADGVMQRQRRDERQLGGSAPAATDRSAAGSHRDCRARTPRCGRGGRGRRSGSSPTIHSGPRSPARASASASALVEPIVS